MQKGREAQGEEAVAQAEEQVRGSRPEVVHHKRSHRRRQHAAQWQQEREATIQHSCPTDICRDGELGVERAHEEAHRERGYALGMGQEGKLQGAKFLKLLVGLVGGQQRLLLLRVAAVRPQSDRQKRHQQRQQGEQPKGHRQGSAQITHPPHGREEQRTHLGAGGEGGDEDPPMPQGALGEGVACAAHHWPKDGHHRKARGVSGAARAGAAQGEEHRSEGDGQSRAEPTAAVAEVVQTQPRR
mmetsp:Transcript_32655/g.78020  ORF Transcript_32655/g.78020 Transcript_32655/m.78020 type:complete len:242 (-) Transcript_32655:315-1040(-)